MMTKEDTRAAWSAFLRNPEAYDKSTFTPLLTEAWSEAELADLVAPFERSAELARRISDVRKHVAQNGAVIPIEASDPELMECARELIAAKCTLCEIAGDEELTALLSGTRIRLETNQSAHDAILRGDTPHNWLIECIGDLFRARRTDRSPAAYALIEAFYGMQSSFDLQWYCSQPLTDLDHIDLAPFFRFWSMGGALAFGGEETLVRRNA